MDREEIGNGGTTDDGEGLRWWSLRWRTRWPNRRHSSHVGDIPSKSIQSHEKLSGHENIQSGMKNSKRIVEFKEGTH